MLTVTVTGGCGYLSTLIYNVAGSGQRQATGTKWHMMMSALIHFTLQYWKSVLSRSFLSPLLLRCCFSTLLYLTLFFRTLHMNERVNVPYYSTQWFISIWCPKCCLLHFYFASVSSAHTELNLMPLHLVLISMR